MFLLLTDNSQHRYVAIKVCIQTKPHTGPMHRELEIYQHLAGLGSRHPGQAYIRGLYETFDLSGPDGCHLCLVHPPLHMTISELQRHGRHQRYNQKLLRETLTRLFRALEFLHDIAGVVHTGT